MIHQKVLRATDCCIWAWCVGALWKHTNKMSRRDTCFLVLKGCQNLTSHQPFPSLNTCVSLNCYTQISWSIYVTLLKSRSESYSPQFTGNSRRILSWLRKHLHLNMWKLLEWLQFFLFTCCELLEGENQGCSMCKKWLHRNYFLFCYKNCILNNGKFLILNINHALHVMAYFRTVHINNTNYLKKKNKGKFLWSTKLLHPLFIFEPVPVCQIIPLILNNQYPLQLSIVFFILKEKASGPMSQHCENTAVFPLPPLLLLKIVNMHLTPSSEKSITVHSLNFGKYLTFLFSKSQALRFISQVLRTWIHVSICLSY